MATKPSSQVATDGGSLFAGIIVFGMFIPFAYSLVTALSWIWLSDWNWVWGYSLVVIVILWAVGGALLRGFTTVERAQPSSYLEFRARLDTLNTLFEPQANSGDAIEIRAISEIKAHLDGIGEQLGLVPEGPASSAKKRLSLKNLQWVSGDGYLGAWSRLQRAEEALTIILPATETISVANSQEARVRNSAISDSDVLLYQIGQARRVIVQYAGLSPIWNDTGHQSIRETDAFKEQSDAKFTRGDELAAREVLRAVQRTVNEYREDRRAAILSARNRMYVTVFVTTVLLAVTVLAAVVAGDHANHVVVRDGLTAGLAFFFLGAITGLFNRLYVDAGNTGDADASVHDYGFSTAQVIHAVTLCGLAGVIGAVIFPIVGVLSADPIELPSLTHIFSLQSNTSGLLFAAVSGLAPSALVGRLQQEAGRYKSDLKKSEATTSS